MDKKLNLKGLSALNWVMLIVAGWLLIFGIWSSYEAYVYISDLLGSGQLVLEGNWYNIFSYFMSSVVQYFVFALVLIALSSLLKTKSTVVEKIEVKEVKQEENQDHDDSEDDEFFEDFQEVTEETGDKSEEK